MAKPVTTLCVNKTRSVKPFSLGVFFVFYGVLIWRISGSLFAMVFLIFLGLVQIFSSVIYRRKNLKEMVSSVRYGITFCLLLIMLCAFIVLFAVTR